jgi:excisionase family DNA binding protein
MARDGRIVPIMLTPEEVAELVGVSIWSVRRLLRSGELPAVRMGRKYLIRVADLAEYLTPASRREQADRDSGV